MNSKCRVSSKELIEVIDFGSQPLGNGFLKKEEFQDEYFFKMKLGFCNESKLLQLFDQPEPTAMFHDEYAFFSCTSNYMKKHFEYWANNLYQSNKVENPLILEIGCNDGIFLQNFVGKSCRVVGVEPSKNVADIAESKGIAIVNQFMNIQTAKDFLKRYGKADYITAANVICHIPNILELAQCIDHLLTESGKFIFEEPYLGDIINKCSYDQIYDEHVYLFSCTSVQKLFGIYGLELIDAEHQSTHGGSMRYTIARANSYEVSNNAIHFLEQEKAQGFDKIETMLDLGKRIKESKNELVSLLESLNSNGKRICGYAATSKSTTILNYCNIDKNLIECIYDTTPLKQGKFSPGMHIPIVKWEDFSSNMPDYTFLFAWNHLDEIMKKEMDYTKSGRKWITHIPKVKVS